MRRVPQIVVTRAQTQTQTQTNTSTTTSTASTDEEPQIDFNLLDPIKLSLCQEHMADQTTITTINPLSAMMRFHIHSAYYLVILYSFKNLSGGLE
ncbi:hypothetical protein E2C01_032218 [Portunus trituberculatus]|uniref:Uncharacterized protein n=1 Tax=Portunus trituberculatus TaxID=210409 RepID=A0A5B7F008_PORTR|nr:hypothetical protein [Portunus trituberculatus]